VATLQGAGLSDRLAYVLGWSDAESDRRGLREICEGKRDLPRTNARRHHYVPAFLLAQFAAPRGDRRSFMAQLDASSGRLRRTTPNDAYFEPDLYVKHGDDGRDNTLEAFFSVIERHSPPAIRRLLADPLRRLRKTARRSPNHLGPSRSERASSSGQAKSS
jgi:hypothetical protein